MPPLTSRTKGLSPSTPGRNAAALTPKSTYKANSRKVNKVFFGWVVLSIRTWHTLPFSLS